LEAEITQSGSFNYAQTVQNRGPAYAWVTQVGNFNEAYQSQDKDLEGEKMTATIVQYGDANQARQDQVARRGHAAYIYQYGSHNHAYETQYDATHQPPS